jgi:hypothetical protein
MGLVVPREKQMEIAGRAFIDSFLARRIDGNLFCWDFEGFRYDRQVVTVQRTCGRARLAFFFFEGTTEGFISR